MTATFSAFGRGLRDLGRRLRRFHADEVGSQGLEKLLIIAAIVLPLLGLLIIFRNEIKDWVVEIWKLMRGQADQSQGEFFNQKL